MITLFMLGASLCVLGLVTASTGRSASSMTLVKLGSMLSGIGVAILLVWIVSMV